MMKYRKITIQGILHFQLVLCMIIKLLTSFLGSFNNLTYITDVINIYLISLGLKRYRNCKKDVHEPVVMITVLVIFDIFELIIRQQGLALFFWGARNQYRFILSFLAFSIIFSLKHLTKLNTFIQKILVANFVAIAIEFALGYRQDLLSGLFGIVIGSNNGANLFLCIAFASILVDYLSKSLQLRTFLLYLAGILLWVAAAELKYFFIEAAIILFVLLMIIKKASRRKIGLIALGVVGGITGIWLLTYLNPYYTGFFNVNSIVNYANNIGIGSMGYKRVNAIPMTNQYIFRNDLLSRLFGLGLGSAEQSTMTIFNSAIYEKFSHFNYTALFYGFTYIERGWFGLLWYAGFYVMCLVASVKELKKTPESNRVFLYKAIAAVIICFLQMIYDDALRRIPAGFLMYAFLAFPYIIRKENHRQTVLRNVI